MVVTDFSLKKRSLRLQRLLQKRRVALTQLSCCFSIEQSRPCNYTARGPPTSDLQTGKLFYIYLPHQEFITIRVCNCHMAGFHPEKNVWGGSSGKCRAKCFEVN